MSSLNDHVPVVPQSLYGEACHGAESHPRGAGAREGAEHLNENGRTKKNDEKNVSMAETILIVCILSPFFEG